MTSVELVSEKNLLALAVEPMTTSKLEEDETAFLLNVSPGEETERASDVTDCASKPTYYGLLANFPNFRWFLVSYALTHAGEWLTYVASMAMLQDKHDGESTATTLSLSILVVARMVPIAAFSPIGGLLADSLDRRTVMTILDVVGAGISLLFLLSYHLDSHVMLYVVTILQETVTGLYEPSRSAIVPQLVDSHHLTLANTMVGWVWSLMAAVGSSIGGILVANYGIPVCFLSDCAGYLLSALVLWTGVSVAARTAQKTSTELVAIDSTQKADLEVPASSREYEKQIASESQPIGDMILETWSHLKSPSSVGCYVFVKFSGAITFGASDVLMSSFARVHGNLSSERLGILFAFVGIGCLIGPALVQLYRTENVESWKHSSALAFMVVAFGFFGVGIWTPNLVASDENLVWYFAVKCLATTIRTMGVATLWIDSSLILQTVTPNELLGRVSAVDLTLATLGESSSAFAAGILSDYLWQLTAEQIALCCSLVCFSQGLMWMVIGSKHR